MQDDLTNPEAAEATARASSEVVRPRDDAGRTSDGSVRMPGAAALPPAQTETETVASEHAALTQLRAYLAQESLPESGRLPAERELCDILGVRRSELRKALAVMEAEGRIWRHVGRGTFIGTRPADPADLAAVADRDLVTVATRTNPAEVMRTRLLFEPEIAREAALNASARDIEAMRRVLADSRGAQSWRQYESLDNNLHRLIAEATRNGVVLALFDALNTVRRTVVWGRLRADRPRPPADHHSFAEHEAIVAAIADRDRDAAAEAMRAHLQSVERHLVTGRAARRSAEMAAE
jgi:DNA-binding FadR family transcriptional regulator